MERWEAVMKPVGSGYRAQLNGDHINITNYASIAKCGHREITVSHAEHRHSRSIITHRRKNGVCRWEVAEHYHDPMPTPCDETLAIVAALNTLAEMKSRRAA